MWNSTYRTFPSLSNTTYSRKALPVINVPQRIGAHPSVDELVVDSPNPEITRKRSA